MSRLRSVSQHLRVVVAAIASVLLAGVGATAADAAAPPPVPADAATVAGPTASGATLVAFGHGASLCLAVRDRGGHVVGGPSCMPRVPLRLDPYAPVDQAGADVVFGAAPPAVATVEADPGNGVPVSAPTTDGAAYRGPFAGQARFWLLELGPASSPAIEPDPFKILRWRDATGAVVSASADLFAGGPLVRRPVTVVRGRGDGGAWSVRAETRRAFAPTAAVPERFVNHTCLYLTNRFGGDMLSGSCDDPPQGHPLSYGITGSCGLTAVGGWADADVHTIAVTTTDGRRHRVRPRVLANRRLWAFVSAPRVGIRTVAALRPSRTVAPEVLGLAPNFQRCNLGVSQAILTTFRSTSTTSAAGLPALTVADRGDLLCVSLGSLRPDGGDCSGFVLPDFLPASIEQRVTPDGTLVGGVTGPEVASVEIGTTSGHRMTASAETDIGYRGPYYGHVHFVRAELPRGERAVWMALRDAAGRTIRTVPAPDLPLAQPLRAVARLGRFRLAAGRSYDLRSTRACAALVAGALPSAPDACQGLSARSAQIHASCAPRALTVLGAAGPGTRRVELVLDGGRRRSLALHRLPGERTLRAYAAATGPRDTLRAVRLVRRRGTTVLSIAQLPPAARQCGYGEIATPWGP
jgi:hypothetical protein